MGKILSISLKPHFIPNTLGDGLKAMKGTTENLQSGSLQQGSNPGPPE